MTNKIAVIGGTGLIGNPVVKHLAQNGFNITCLVRNKASAQQKLTKEVALITGDLRSERDVAQLLAGQDALYLNLNLAQHEKKNDFHTESDGMKVIISAAQKSNIKRIALISSLVMNYQGMNGFNWWVFDVKREAVRLIKQSGIPYTIFYPSTFMENFEGNYRMGNNMLVAGRSEHKLYFIAADDYARQVASSFHILTTENKEYAVQGPQAFTIDEAVRAYVKAYNKSKLRIRTAPLGMLKFFGLFNQKMNYGWHIIEALNKYPETFVAQRTWDELGKPTITIQDFARREMEN